MRIRMSPMNVQGDDRDEDRSIDQNQGEEKIHSQQRDRQRRRGNQIDQQKVKHLQGDKNRDRQRQFLAAITWKKKRE